MPRVLLTLFLVLVVSLTILAGCQSHEDASSPSAETVSTAPSSSQGSSAKRQTRIVVPPEVQGQWKAVKIEVEDKDRHTEDVYTVDVGGELQVPGTSLRIQVKNFLPSFIMDGATITSASNETNNPGAQVVITDGDREVFNGWLFSLYPGAHPFQHPRYGFTLVDFVPTDKKSVDK